MFKLSYGMRMLCGGVRRRAVKSGMRLNQKRTFHFCLDDHELTMCYH